MKETLEQLRWQYEITGEEIKWSKEQTEVKWGNGSWLIIEQSQYSSKKKI